MNERWEEKRKRLKVMLSDRGIDRMVTSLKRMEYQKFLCNKSPDGMVYICGLTKDRIFDIRGAKYNAGPYYACISHNSIVNMEMSPIHIFPARYPKTKNRHLHHYTSSVYVHGEILHPLESKESTCWGSVGTAYRSALDDCDIADLFRILNIFTTRLDWSSALCPTWASEVIGIYGERL
jgi:hypothetical protein